MLLHIWILLSGKLMMANSELLIPGARGVCYAKPGDVLIGAIYAVTEPDPDNPGQCRSRSGYYIQKIEALMYAATEINQDPNLLPNITLGLVIFETCRAEELELGQAVYFLPSDDMLSPQDVSNCGETEAKHQYDITTVIGMGSSASTVPVSLAMTSAEIPVIGSTETSDELSDRGRFPYFVPSALPNRYQADAILQILQRYNWTYFALIYDEGSYGENGAKEIQKRISEYGLCIEYTFLIFKADRDKYLAELYHRLKHYTVSHAIVLFLSSGRFFWIMPDELHQKHLYISAEGLSYVKYQVASDGLILLSLEHVSSPEFEQYYRTRTPLNNEDNPWWQDYFYNEAWQCSWNDEATRIALNDTRIPCSDLINSTLPEDRRYYAATSVLLDTVNTTAHGLDLLIRKTCPEAFIDSSLLPGCLNGIALHQAILNISYDGYLGRIEYTDDGEIKSSYVIKQYDYSTNDYDIVGRWQKVGGLQVYTDSINWTKVHPENIDAIPESVCSQPCLPRQYMIEKEVVCCWECHYCRDNEIIINGSMCEVCKENSWPDEGTATECEPISPIYLKPTDNIGSALTSIAFCGLLLTILSSVSLIILRNKKLIKASSKELMTIILVGIVLAFSSALVILAKPHPTTCFLRDLGFSMSVTVIYAPLLVKTIRVYRIFAGGQKGTTSLVLISNRSQVALTLLLVLAQMVLTIAVCIVKPSAPLTRMPVLTEKYSELLCTLPSEVLIVLLAYNMVILITCAAFGFLTRKLPDNFNESGFIFVSVMTTVFIWVVFLPTYFTTFYAYHKTALLALCLILNGYITLICLFGPKLYAAQFVDEGKMKFVTNAATGTVGTTGGTMSTTAG